MASDRARVSALIRKEDATRTDTDWKKLDTTSLRLKCNEYNVESTGKKDALIERLLEYFSNDPPNPHDQTSSESEDSETALDLTVDHDGDAIHGAENEIPSSSKRKPHQSNHNKKKDGESSDNNNKKRQTSTNQSTQNGTRKIQNGGKNSRRKTPSSPRTPTKTQNKHKRFSPAKKSNPRDLPPKRARPDDDLSALNDKMEIILSTMQATQTEVLHMQSKQAAIELQVGNLSSSHPLQQNPPAASSPATLISTKKRNSDVVPQVTQQQLLPTTTTVSLPSISTSTQLASVPINQQINSHQNA